jgi:hypothetical protein
MTPWMHACLVMAIAATAPDRLAGPLFPYEGDLA